MPRWEPEQTVTVSFLDRLIDLDPKSPADQPPSRARSIRQLKASLRRDLEWLLNSRRRPDAAGKEFRELEKSLFNYGLEDVTAMSWVSYKDRVSLTKMIEQAVLDLRAPHQPHQGGFARFHSGRQTCAAIPDRRAARYGSGARTDHL